VYKTLWRSKCCALPERQSDGEDVWNSRTEQKERSGIPLRSARGKRRKLLTVVIVWVVTVVVVLVPITFRVPLLGVFIPPAMAVFPAPFPRRHQGSTLLCGLRAIPAMFLSGPVQFVIDANDPLLAVLLVGTRLWRTKEQERTGQRGS
jgi:hypothetical protein